MSERSDPVLDFAALWRTGRPDLDAFVKSAGALTPRQLADVVAVDQRERWQAGERVAVDTYFQRYPQLCGDPDLGVDLVYGEYLLHEEHDGTSVETDLSQRFPEFAATLHAQVELHRALADSAAPDEDNSLPRQFGRYDIQRELGRGGMGTVYLARDTQLNRLVALKVPRFDGDPRSSRQFLREARAAAALQHPSICPIYDSGQIDGRHFITMAYLEGESLATRIGRGPLPVAEAVALVSTLANALEEAHRAGIVHRDLKPANILYDKNGQPVITDFGLARSLTTGTGETSSGQGIIGTPAYMAPEQVNGDNAAIGPATDVYALGVVFFELLTGKRPFEGPLGTLLGRITTDDAAMPSTLRPEIDSRLDAICMQALAKNPSKRFPSMAAFAAAIGEANDTSPPARPPARQQTKHDNRRLALAGALAVLVVGSVVAVFALRGDRPGSPNTPPATPAVPPVAAAPHESVRLLVPAYFKLSGSGLKHWETLVRSASHNLIVIVNVDDGPGVKVDAALTKMIERLHSAGATAIGYVGTSYGKHPLDKVNRHVDDWYRLYPALGGIFFEEQNNTAVRAGYYIDAARYVRSKNTKALIVSNPGDHCARVYFECTDINVLCVIESGNDYRIDLPDWMRRDFPDKLGGMIYEVDSVRRMEKRLAELIGAGVRCLYLSDTKENEHFNRLPLWWNELVQSAARHRGPSTTDGRDVVAAKEIADRAWVLNDSDHMDRAIEECDKALKLDDRCVTALMCRANAQIKKRLFDPAIADLNRAANLEPKNEMPHVDLAWAKNEIGEYDQAIAHADQAIALKSESAEAFNQRGWSYFNKRMFHKAVDDFTIAIKHDPNYVSAYQHRSSAYSQLGMTELAEKDIRKADEIEANAKKKGN